MTRRTRRCAAICSVLLALCAQGCGHDKDPDDDAKHPTTSAAVQPASAPARNPLALTTQEQQAAGVRVQPVTPSQAVELLALTGTLIPNQERIASVMPRMPGRILAAPVPLGAQVKAGDRLAFIESIEIGEAQAAWRQARSEATVKEEAFERARNLAREEIIAQKELQRARADAEMARTALRAAQDKLRLLGVAPAAAGARSDVLYPVLAPITGTVTEKHAVAGAHVESESLFTVADLRTVWLEADVFEKDLAALKPGAAATVTVAAHGNRTFAGRLTYVAPTMDAGTRTVKARIEVPNMEGALKPGMFATARLPGGAAAPKLVLPAAAVTLLNDRTSVFVSTPKGFEPRAVDVQQRADGSYEVRSGLQAGEQVAVAGAYALKSRVLKSSLAKDND